MFAGLLGLGCQSGSVRPTRQETEGGGVARAAGSSDAKRQHRKPGYMRGEQSRLQSTTDGRDQGQEEEDEGTICVLNENLSEAPTTVRPAARMSASDLEDNRGVWTSNFSCGSAPLVGKSDGTSKHDKLLPQTELTSDTFSSSFSFIRQSLTTQPGLTRAPETEASCLEPPASKRFSFGGSQEGHSSDGRFWRETAWKGREDFLSDRDSPPLDTEVTSSLSVDSDTASASSGYESATPALDQGWDLLVKKHECVLQDCLQSNRTYTKIESMMLRLQRLQQKAILDDDYDAAERFGKKLQELSRERGDLQLALPSRQPSITLFLEQLGQVVHSVLQRTEARPARDDSELEVGEHQNSSERKERLLKQKEIVEEEMEELQEKLAELKNRSRSLELQIQQEEQQREAEELEGSVLKNYTVTQLRELRRTLQDLVHSENRTQISVSPPAAIHRIQEQEQALNLSIKEATAKVVMSQRLGSSLRRKVSETETQLLALHEAKVAAVSGNDFSGAKELTAEMKAVNLERERVEVLVKRLNSLSCGSSQELARMKEQRQQLRQELTEKEMLHETQLKDNATKYIELLEDKLHSCGCPGLERIWEADLEACHLFLRGLQLRTPSCSGVEMEDLPVAEAHSQLRSKDEEDCAMLTALGGRWCPEADLQNSEFTKKLEEFLFCVEENHQEDTHSETSDLMERCMQICDRLFTLEMDLKSAMENQDESLTESLEMELQQVKITLENMHEQLKMEEEEEEKLQDDDHMEDGTEDEDEEEDEDQYFSDSWEI
ncbi:disrupted in schizophrenia 1 protein isoform X1 [Synchiropus splendidus]|uniref:disrupted in schizophrenia 1 protein isoform X1 n=2 Tax=Synchiropus splendidus TaxID=270530 RepID=UPI00237E4F22|nr:disrupted in schizophrenia 1 protein isoform X1 [Synchiropus splendidus]